MNKCGFKAKYYRYLFEHSLDAILLTRPDGSIIKANPAACTMLGRSEDELRLAGRELIVDMNDPRLRPALAERELEGQVMTELNFIRKDGTVFPTFITSALFEDDEGEMISVMIIRDISRDKEHIQLIEEMKRKAEEDAMHDYLTKSLNRRGFDQLFKGEITRSIRYDLGFCLAIIDVDFFKMTNDRYGHNVGDMVLVEIACILIESTRPYDILGRYGGDEFILCLPNTSEHDGLLILERLRAQVENTAIYAEEHTIRASVSVGFCHFDSENVKHKQYDDFIQCADQFMYKAKQIRNTVYHRGFRKD